MSSLNAEWDAFLEGGEMAVHEPEEMVAVHNIKDGSPKCSDIYISTKTKIAYLRSQINLKEVFWGIPIIGYSEPVEGVVKKQMKFISHSQEELDSMRANLGPYENVDELVLSHLDNPGGRIKFKDVRKVSLGLCKKDILSYRCKQKSAFYNCFVLIFRVKHEDAFWEVHVKVFNTGKLEIPGIKCDRLLEKVLDLVAAECDRFIPGITWSPETETVLINSNFSCGFYINRAKLNSIIQQKYQIACVYDPCSYPGIQCKFYYDSTLDKQTGTIGTKTDTALLKKISFMIFRTGSVLIVGKCDETELMDIYEFLCRMLETEYPHVSEEPSDSSVVSPKITKCKKERKKMITIANPSAEAI